MAVVEPSAGEREGSAPRKEEPSAGVREGTPPRKEEPSAGVREGPAPRKKEPSASRATLDDIRGTFAFFDAWEDKYRFLIDLGKDLATLPEQHRVEDNLVRGCQSQVWLVARYDRGERRLHLAIDSDAHIVRGLIAIVLAAFDDKAPTDILSFDIDALFRELDLVSHLSPARGNGLKAMIGKIRATADSCAATEKSAN